MGKPTSDLEKLSERLIKLYDGGNTPEFRAPLVQLEKASKEVAKAWSGSWLGYHACVYYEDLATPPPGARFSREWGLIRTSFIPGTVGEWREYDFDNIVNAIFEIAGNPSIDEAEAYAEQIKEEFEGIRAELKSIIMTVLKSKEDAYINQIAEKVDHIKMTDASDFIDYLRPTGQIITRDSAAVGQGFRVPPHLSILTRVAAITHNVDSCKDLAKLSDQLSNHMTRSETSTSYKPPVGTKIFIGHGRSPLWKDLKDFVSNRLNLQWDEFNRVPVAGITNVARLIQMMDEASVAFIILTAEDEQADGKMHARMNVIHEAGLFQGRLGFTKSILLLEEGCEEFSNIHGLGQIRFPEGKISAVFEEIRLVLEREGLITGV